MKNKNKDLKVVQNNKFIQKYQRQISKLNFNDLLFFKTLVSKINSKDTLFKDSYTIKYSELDQAGFPDRDRYKEINKSLQALSSTMLVIKTEEGERHSGIIQNDWFYPKRSEEVRIQVYNHMADFLLDIKGKFTKYPLSILNTLTNKYDILLYEYFKSIQDLRQQNMSIKTLKQLLGIENEYKITTHLKQRILDPSINRINENTDTFIFYTDIKTKNKITGFKFIIQGQKKFNFKSYKEQVKGMLIDLNGTKLKIKEIQEIPQENGDYYKIKVINEMMEGVLTIKTDNNNLFTQDEMIEFITKYKSL